MNTTQASLSKMPEYAELLSASRKSTYAFQSTMKFDRTPTELLEVLQKPVPMPHFETTGDKHFPTFAQQLELQQVVGTDR